MIPTHRQSTTPGDMFAMEFMKPRLATFLDLTVEQFDEFLTGKLAVTEALADRLAAFTGTTKDFWLNLQKVCS